jgi:hypothetical protein
MPFAICGQPSLFFPKACQFPLPSRRSERTLARMPPHISPDPSPTSGPLHEKPFAAHEGVGGHVFGLGIMAIGLTGFVQGDFITGQTVPTTSSPHRSRLCLPAFLRNYAAVASACIRGRRRTLRLSNRNRDYRHERPSPSRPFQGIRLLRKLLPAVRPPPLPSWSTGPGAPPRATRPCPYPHQQLAFALCALVWGGAHFIYMNLTAPLVPQWTPPSQVFWGVLSGVASSPRVSLCVSHPGSPRRHSPHRDAGVLYLIGPHTHFVRQSQNAVQLEIARHQLRPPRCHPDPSRPLRKPKPQSVLPTWATVIVTKHGDNSSELG